MKHQDFSTILVAFRAFFTNKKVIFYVIKIMMKRIVEYIALVALGMYVQSCIKQPQVQIAPLSEAAIESLNSPVYDQDSIFMSLTADFKNEIAALDNLYGYDDHGITWLHSTAVEGFAKATDSLAPAVDDVNKSLNHIISAAGKEKLNIARKGYATVIWGKPQSIIFSDSVMLVALNHYLGADFDGYSSMPKYRRLLKNREFLPYDMAEALVATSYPATLESNSPLINKMIYDGIIAEAKMRLVNHSNPASALGYDESEYQWLTDNEAMIWDKMVGTRLIFDTSETTADRLLSPAPASAIISPECPGRVGRFIGYKIVKSYLDNHPGVSLPDLLTNGFYSLNNPLTEAYYRP